MSLELEYEPETSALQYDGDVTGKPLVYRVGLREVSLARVRQWYGTSSIASDTAANVSAAYTSALANMSSSSTESGDYPSAPGLGTGQNGLYDWNTSTLVADVGCSVITMRMATDGVPLDRIIDGVAHIWHKMVTGFWGGFSVTRQFTPIDSILLRYGFTLSGTPDLTSAAAMSACVSAVDCTANVEYFDGYNGYVHVPIPDTMTEDLLTADLDYDPTGCTGPLFRVCRYVELVAPTLDSSTAYSGAHRSQGFCRRLY